MQIRGIRCEETPWAQGPGGIQRQYTVEEKGGAGLVPGPETGALSIDTWTFREWAALAGLGAEDAALFGRPAELTLQCGGWQSWSAGWELGSRETLPRSVRIIPELLKQTNRPGDLAPPAIPPRPEAPEAAPLEAPEQGRAQDWLAGHFITYLRAGDLYLCAASREGGASPPVSFRINRERQVVVAEVFCPGKVWRGGGAAGRNHPLLRAGILSL
jgi:alpha-galactosidase